MLANLVESKPKRARRAGGPLASFLVHYGLVLGVIYTSAQAATVDDGPRQETVSFVEPPKPEPERPKEPAPELVVAPRPPRTAVVLTTLLEIPSVIPDIDLRRSPTDPEAFRSGRPTDGFATPRGEPDSGMGRKTAFFDFEVESPVRQAPGSVTPAYPDILRQAGVEGEALVSFEVDTAGRADMGTFKVIRTTHEQFAVSVRTALPRMRFIPAERGARRVRQLVQQPFSFAIVREEEGEGRGKRPTDETGS